MVDGLRLRNIKQLSYENHRVNGKTFDTRDHLGKVVLIDFALLSCKRVTKTIRSKTCIRTKMF